MSLKNKTLFITGASRGIGLAIALRAARDGANVVVAAKTTEPPPQLPGTIHTAAEAIERAGGHALPIALDIRDDAAVQAAAKQAADTFGGIDILVNNASALSLGGTLATPMKRFDLMFAVNVRGTVKSQDSGDSLALFSWRQYLEWRRDDEGGANAVTDVAVEGVAASRRGLVECGRNLPASEQTANVLTMPVTCHDFAIGTRTSIG
jgi:NAD(P)-dependent dehydrogenase (short-subunit alcohol dehydrogenase family)